MKRSLPSLPHLHPLSATFRVLPISLLVVALLFSLGTTVVFGQTALPTLTKTFLQDTIGPGSVSRLEFTISNPSSSPVTDMAFTDNLPAGVTVATPARSTSTCIGDFTAPDGGTSISLVDGRLGGGASCVMGVDVTSSTVGVHTNTTSDFTSSAGNSGTATDDLTVDAGRPGFSKSFSPNPITPGGTSTLTFLVDNTANATAATTLSFADNLPSGMVVATPANATTDCRSTLQPATLTASPGSNSISMNALGNGGFPVLAAGATCTVRVDVSVTGAGTFVNVSDVLNATVGFSLLTGGFATAALQAPRETITKRFVDDPVAPGGTVELAFTLTNFDRVNTSTNMAFTDDLDATLSGIVAVGPLSTGTCDGTLTGTSVLSYSGGTLAPEATCSFSVTLQVPTGTTGTFTNTTSAITFDRDGQSITGNQATDDLTVAALPVLTKEFTDDPVVAGGTVTLEFSVTNTSAAAALSDISFIDELTTFLAFPISATLPADGFCGPGSSMSLIGLDTERQGLFMTGGSLAASSVCTFSVSLDIPDTTPIGTLTNITEPITALLDGEQVEGRPATDDLVILAAPELTKNFLDDPVVAGGTVGLEFTIVLGADALGNATDIAFTDDLEAALSGLVADGITQTDICGVGSSVSGTSVLSFTGGTLAPGESCTFSVPVTVPVSAVPNAYTNITSDITATMSGLAVTNSPATDVLNVASDLDFTKEFTDDPATPGGTVTLAFTITNGDTINDATDIAFTDELDSVIDGLAASGLPVNDVCGIGSSLTQTGGGVLSLTGGSLVAGASCTFSAVLNVPSNADLGEYTNRTSEITATVDGATVRGLPATDDLVLIDAGNTLTLSKEFIDDPVEPGATVTLRFNVLFEGINSATGISFTDDLDAMLSGAVAVNTPQGVCGGNLTGTSVLTFSGGTLSAVGSCTIDVQIQVPAGAASASYPNTTSTITATVVGTPVEGDPATDNLLVTDRPDVPVADAGEDQTVECTDEEGAPVTLDGSGSFDPDGAALTYSWTVPGEDEEGNPIAVVIATGETPTVNLGLGVHTITLTVTNPDTESATDEVVITVEDTTGPVLTLNGDNPLTLECGIDTYDEPGATAIDACDGISYPVTITGTVDPSTPGTYELTYSANDAHGNTTVEIRTVEVVDTTPPVITLLGANPLIINRFSGPYTDPGADVTDACDANPTLMVTGDDIDTNVPGVHTVAFDAEDAAGHTAQEARTVKVIDDPNALAHPFLLLADEDIDIDKNSGATGDIHANGKINVKKGPATYTGNFTALDEIDIDKDNTIDGAVTSGDEVKLGNNVTVTGTVTEFATVPAETLPELNFTAGGNDITVDKDETQALAPGSYGDVEVKDGGTLQLTTGDYFFEKFTIQKESFLEVDLPTGPVNINVTGKVDFKKDVTMSISPLGAIDSRYVRINAMDKVDIDQGGVIMAQIIAPEDQVQFNKEVLFTGLICAENINIDKDGSLTHPGPGTTATGSASLVDGPTWVPPDKDKPEALGLARTLDSNAKTTDSGGAVPQPVAADVPNAVLLEANYPNPFNPVTTIRFGVPEAAAVTLVVYDLLGREVRRLVDGAVAAGMHTATFEAASLPSGLYVYRLTTPEGSFTQTMLLLK